MNRFCDPQLTGAPPLLSGVVRQAITLEFPRGIHMGLFSWLFGKRAADVPRTEELTPEEPADPSKPTLDIRDGATIAFGPCADRVSKEALKGSDPNKVIVIPKLSTFTSRAKKVRSFTLVFAHFLPEQRREADWKQSVQRWYAYLVDSTPWGGSDKDIQKPPDIFQIESEQSVVLKVCWKIIESQTILRIAAAWEQQYTSYGGKWPETSSGSTPDVR